jgi:hypothetical protein
MMIPNALLTAAVAIDATLNYFAMSVRRADHLKSNVFLACFACRKL